MSVVSLIVVFSGPEGTIFDGGVFPARLSFPHDYPLNPPKMKFTCDLFHPNSKFQTFTYTYLLSSARQRNSLRENLNYEADIN